jgi:translation initiation factor 1A
MPNKKGGKKFKKGKKETSFDRKLILKDPKEDQEYAKIKKVNGSGRYQLLCFDGSERLGIAAGNIRKKTRLILNDIVLVSLWDFQESKCSIIHKYESDEVQKLKSQNQFPKNINLEEDNPFSENDVSFSFNMPSDEEETEENKDKSYDSSSSSDEEINMDDI